MSIFTPTAYRPSYRIILKDMLVVRSMELFLKEKQKRNHLHYDLHKKQLWSHRRKAPCGSEHPEEYWHQSSFSFLESRSSFREWRSKSAGTFPASIPEMASTDKTWGFTILAIIFPLRVIHISSVRASFRYCLSLV